MRKVNTKEICYSMGVPGHIGVALDVGQRSVFVSCSSILDR